MPPTGAIGKLTQVAGHLPKRSIFLATVTLATVTVMCGLSGKAQAGAIDSMPLITGDSAAMVHNSPYYALDQSTGLMVNGQCAQAVPLLAKALEKDPVNIFTNFDLGFCYLDLAQTAVDKGHNSPTANYRERISSLLKKSQFYFQRVQDLNPDLSMTYFKLGKVALLLNDPQQAIDYYKAGLEVAPENAALEFNLARVYDQTQQADLAIHHYIRSISLDPNFIYAYNNLGLLYEQRKNYKGAEKAYKEALKHDSTYNFARLNLGNLYAEQDRLSEAKTLYLEALRLEPNNSWAHLYLGNIYFMTSDFESAIKSYQASIKGNPEMATAYYLLAISFSKMERVDDALSASLQYMNLEPQGKYAEQLKHLIVALRLQKTGNLFTETARHAN